METLQKHSEEPLHPELTPNLYFRVLERYVCFRIIPSKDLLHHCVRSPNVLLLRHETSEDKFFCDDQIAEKLEGPVGRKQSQQKRHYVAHASNIVDVRTIQLISSR